MKPGEPIGPEGDFGFKFLVGTMLFVGLIIIAFGMATAISPLYSRRMSGFVIMGIGVLDLVLTYWAMKKLPNLTIKQ